MSSWLPFFGVAAGVLATGLWLLRRRVAGATFAEPVSLRGRTVIVTGASSGIGLATARLLLERGAVVVMACRDVARARLVGAELVADRSAMPGAAIEVMALDLSSFASIAAFAGEYNAHRLPPLAALVCNAGYYGPSSMTEDGLELTAQANLYGHSFLVRLMWDTLAEHGSRVVVVSSSLHKRATKREFDELVLGADRFDARSPPKPPISYRASKLGCVLFADELNKRFVEAGLRCRANAVHPGVVRTQLGRDLGIRVQIFCTLVSWLIRTPEQGAQVSVYAVASEKLAGVGGRYLYDCRDDSEAKNDLAKESSGDALRRALWDKADALLAHLCRVHGVRTAALS